MLSHRGTTPIGGPTASAGHRVATESTVAPRIEVLRSKNYTSVASLVADTELVAYVTATSGVSTGELNSLPFTVTTMHIDRVLRGKAPDTKELPLRQIGPGDLSEGIEIVQPGHQYLIFLGKISFTPGTTNGQWYVVGLQAGLYEVASGTVRRTDAESTRLPTNVPLSQFEAAVLAPPTPGP